MDFTLTYRGKIPSTGRPQSKADIRDALHPQLQALWGIHPALAQNRAWITPGAPPGQSLLSTVGGYTMTALVHSAVCLYAELDILMLVPRGSGSLIRAGGDIDNRLKTLFDALRLPTATELPAAWVPAAQPYHCLLEDDGLITRASVDTDYLLKPVTGRGDVELTIRVHTRPSAVTWANIALSG